MKPRRSGPARPFITHYYSSVEDPPAEWARIGRAASPLGQRRAAFWHILCGQYEYATLHDARGVTTGKIWRVGNKIASVGV